MTVNLIKKPITLAALRAKMGNWVYYITFMKMNDLVERIACGNTFYSSKTLQELLQRQILPGRAKEIESYLIMQPQRFFNALVIGTYGGDPQWQELTIKPSSDIVPTLPKDLEGTMGFLVLNGSEKLFPIDGQHRIEGIRRALKDHPELGSEEVCAILVRGITGEHRSEDEEGFQRTRRLFTTLNRYAKPVNKKDIIALDEDDTVAIITRRLVEFYPLFIDKTSVKGATSISVSDKQSFTSINALYDALDIFLNDTSRVKWAKFKRFNPGEPRIEELLRNAISLWDNFCATFQAVREIKNSNPNDKAAGNYRTANGGNVLFRPIGLLLYVKIIRMLMTNNELTLEQAMERVSRVPTELSVAPWAHLIWNPLNNKIITASANRKAAEKLLFYAVGGDLKVLNSSEMELRKELSDIRNVPEAEIILRSYV